MPPVFISGRGIAKSDTAWARRTPGWCRIRPRSSGIMESETLYGKLQRHLDQMRVGLPATASGLEIRILKQLFAPEEAAVALALSAIPEPASVLHKRQKMPFAEL